MNQLIEYDHWANQRIFDAMRKVKDSAEESAEMYRLFAHILGAQDVWISRINGEKPTLAIWPKLSMEEMEERLLHHPKKLDTLIPRAEETIRYQNQKGDSFTNTVEEILLQLIIHGQHHRAQIALLMRQVGVTPPGTDFIFFLRKCLRKDTA